jgi:hypothetical protein
MAKSVRAHLELASVNDIRAICAKDASEVSSRPDKYIEGNLLGVYVLVNTWLLMIEQWSKYGWVHVRNYMLDHGLIAWIKQCDLAALDLIHGERDVEFSLVRNIIKDVIDMGPLHGIPHDENKTHHVNSMSAILQLLRYGKRFSPLFADKLRDESLEGFVSLQRELKYWQRQPSCEYVYSRVREVVSNLVDWESLCDELDSVDLTDIVFTPGVGFETKADLVSKLSFVAKARVEYFPSPFGIPLLCHQGCDEPEYWGKNAKFEVHKVRAVAVPKNYKTARIIAPEDTLRQAFARRYFQILDRYAPSDHVTLHDQTINQALALAGSLDGSLATIDLSSASDRITWVLLRNVFPKRFLDILTRVLPTHYVYKDTVRLLQSAATMGNSVTFWLESMVFLGISLAAIEFCRFWGVEADVTDKTVHVYGDDIIVPSNTAVTVIEWLERCGFVVNTDKSFFDYSEDSSDAISYYRESCGEEYYGGVSVASVFFPRFPLEGKLGGKLSPKYYRDSFRGTKVDSMSALIDLQHKLFNLCHPASSLLAELIFESDERMTTSSPDEGLSDVWSYDSTPVIMPAPAAEIVIDANGKRRFKKIVVDGMVREAHLGPVYQVPKSQSGKASEELLVSLYNYLHFLKFGPRYDTPLDELLGISSPPISISEARLDGEIVWRLLK